MALKNWDDLKIGFSEECQYFTYDDGNIFLVIDDDRIRRGTLNSKTYKYSFGEFLAIVHKLQLGAYYAFVEDLSTYGITIQQLSKTCLDSADRYDWAYIVSGLDAIWDQSQDIGEKKDYTGRVENVSDGLVRHAWSVMESTGKFMSFDMFYEKRTKDIARITREEFKACESYLDVAQALDNIQRRAGDIRIKALKKDASTKLHELLEFECRKQANRPDTRQDAGMNETEVKI